MLKRILSLTVIVCFFLTSLGPLPQAHANPDLGLPAPGTMVNLSPAYNPVIIKGLTVHKDNPFLFDFIVDVGQDRMSGEPLKKEGEKLIKYFLASLAIPDKDLWVNLSPYEKNKIIPEALGQTDMGRDLLEQDYILKQITASLIYPEKQLGKVFWDKVYAKAQQMYGTTKVPVNTFNKVWITADKAEVFERNQTVFVVDCHFKVMLEEDYLALQKHIGNPSTKRTTNDTHSLASNIVRQIILPELEGEVNTGKNFANLRQIFNSIILSSWYKRNLKEALLNQVYADKSKVKGINLNDSTIKQQIYEQYLKAYKKGVFNYIKEDVDAAGINRPRKYFSGGVFVPGAATHATEVSLGTFSQAMTTDQDPFMRFTTGIVPSSTSANAAMSATAEGNYRNFHIKVTQYLIAGQRADRRMNFIHITRPGTGRGEEINIQRRLNLESSLTAENILEKFRGHLKDQKVNNNSTSGDIEKIIQSLAEKTLFESTKAEVPDEDIKDIVQRVIKRLNQQNIRMDAADALNDDNKLTPIAIGQLMKIIQQAIEKEFGKKVDVQKRLEVVTKIRPEIQMVEESSIKISFVEASAAMTAQEKAYIELRATSRKLGILGVIAKVAILSRPKIQIVPNTLVRKIFRLVGQDDYAARYIRILSKNKMRKPYTTDEIKILDSLIEMFRRANTFFRAEEYLAKLGLKAFSKPTDSLPDIETRFESTRQQKVTIDEMLGSVLRGRDPEFKKDINDGVNLIRAGIYEGNLKARRNELKKYMERFSGIEGTLDSWRQFWLAMMIRTLNDFWKLSPEDWGLDRTNYDHQFNKITYILFTKQLGLKNTSALERVISLARTYAPFILVDLIAGYRISRVNAAMMAPEKKWGLLFDLEGTLIPDAEVVSFEGLYWAFAKDILDKDPNDPLARREAEAILADRKEKAKARGGSPSTIAKGVGLTEDQYYEGKGKMGALLYPALMAKNHPQMVALLKKLSEHYELVLLTNQKAPFAMKFLKMAGLSQFFNEDNVLTASADGTLKKPDVRALRMALEKFQAKGIEPKNIIAIGDHPERDVEPLMALGTHGITVADQNDTAENLLPQIEALVRKEKEKLSNAMVSTGHIPLSTLTDIASRLAEWRKFVAGFEAANARSPGIEEAGHLGIKYRVDDGIWGPHVTQVLYMQEDGSIVLKYQIKQLKSEEIESYLIQNVTYTFNQGATRVEGKITTEKNGTRSKPEAILINEKNVNGKVTSVEFNGSAVTIHGEGPLFSNNEAAGLPSTRPFVVFSPAMTAEPIVLVKDGLFAGLPDAMESLKDRDLAGVRVLFRSNLNISFVDGKVSDIDTERLYEAVPILRLLLDQGADVIMVGHNGQAKPKDSRHSVEPTAEFYQEQFPEFSVKFYPKSIDEGGLHVTPADLVKDSTKTRKGSLSILENLRYGDEEKPIGSEKRIKFRDQLTALASIFILDAFADLDSKGVTIEDLAPQFVLAGKEYFVGPSMVKESEKLSRAIKNGVKALILGAEKEKKVAPIVDIINGERFAKDGFVLLGSSPSSKLSDDHALKKDLRVLTAEDYVGDKSDIGRKTIRTFLTQLDTLKEGDTIEVNGVLGWAENTEHPEYEIGTKIIWHKLGALAEKRGVNVIFAGGSGGVFARKYGIDKFPNVDLVTAGGVTNKLLAGQKLAGVEALKNAMATQPLDINLTSVFKLQTHAQDGIISNVNILGSDAYRIYYSLNDGTKGSLPHKAISSITYHTNNAMTAAPVLERASRRLIESVEEKYEQAGANRNDETLEPMIATEDGWPVGEMKPNDLVILTNHRGDRVLPVFEALTDPDFNQNGMRIDVVPNQDLKIVPLVAYDKKLLEKRGIEPAFKPVALEYETVSDLMEKDGVVQGRFAESNKGEHVRYFWDGRRQYSIDQYRQKGITVRVTPSESKPDEEKDPHMKYAQVAQDMVDFLEENKGQNKVFALGNFATDIQGHVLNGDMDRARKTVLATDEALGKVREKVKELGGVLIVTADHGNVEQMFVLDEDGNFVEDKYGRIPSTQHSPDNPVPFIVEGLNDVEFIKSSPGEQLGLANVGPTILDVMGIKPAEGMSQSLLKRYSRLHPKGPVVVIVRDGWGIDRFQTKDSIAGNPIVQNNLPVDRDLMEKDPWILLKAHGDAVGLPESQMGDSDNGHTTMGAGRRVPTQFENIMAQIKDESFYRNEVLRKNIQQAIDEGRDITITTGLLSEGGVHSHDQYVLALLRLCAEMGVQHSHSIIKLHAELDGRDVMTRIRTQSGAFYLDKVLQEAQRLGLSDHFVIGSVNGRKYGMDRDAYNGERGAKGATELTKQIWKERFGRAYWAKFGLIVDLNKIENESPKDRDEELNNSPIQQLVQIQKDLLLLNKDLYKPILQSVTEKIKNILVPEKESNRGVVLSRMNVIQWRHLVEQITDDDGQEGESLKREINALLGNSAMTATNTRTGNDHEMDGIIRNVLIEPLEYQGLDSNQIVLKLKGIIAGHPMGVLMADPVSVSIGDLLDNEEVLTSTGSVSAEVAEQQVQKGFARLFKVKAMGYPDVFFLIKTLTVNDLPITIEPFSRGTHIKGFKGGDAILIRAEASLNFKVVAASPNKVDVYKVSHDRPLFHIGSITPSKNPKTIFSSSGIFNLTYRENDLRIDSNQREELKVKIDRMPAKEVVDLTNIQEESAMEQKLQQAISNLLNKIRLTDARVEQALNEFKTTALVNHTPFVTLSLDKKHRPIVQGYDMPPSPQPGVATEDLRAMHSEESEDLLKEAFERALREVLVTDIDLQVSREFCRSAMGTKHVSLQFDIQAGLYKLVVSDAAMRSGNDDIMEGIIRKDLIEPLDYKGLSPKQIIRNLTILLATKDIGLHVSDPLPADIEGIPDQEEILTSTGTISVEVAKQQVKKGLSRLFSVKVMGQVPKYLSIKTLTINDLPITIKPELGNQEMSISGIQRDTKVKIRAADNTYLFESETGNSAVIYIVQPDGDLQQIRRISVHQPSKEINIPSYGNFVLTYIKNELTISFHLGVALEVNVVKKAIEDTVSLTDITALNSIDTIINRTLHYLLFKTRLIDARIEQALDEFRLAAWTDHKHSVTFSLDEKQRPIVQAYDSKPSPQQGKVIKELSAINSEGVLRKEFERALMGVLFTETDLGAVRNEVREAILEGKSSVVLKLVLENGTYKLVVSDPAMRAGHLTNDDSAMTHGGIDLSTSNGMQWKDSKEGSGVEMNVDPAMIARVRRGGVDSLFPVVYSITPISSIWPLVGLQTPVKAEHMAGV